MELKTIRPKVWDRTPRIGMSQLVSHQPSPCQMSADGGKTAQITGRAKSLGSGALGVARLMRAAVGGKKFLLKVSRELSGVVTHLGDKPSSRPTRSAILCRQMKPSAVSGFHHIARELSLLPLDSHPVRFKQMGDVIWTHGKYLPAEQYHPTRTAGQVIENTLLTEDMEMVTLGSDGSVHLFEGLAACAWVIHQTEGQHLKACYVLENMSSISSYRSELEGMYRGLVDVKSRLTPASIRQWCNNKAAVDKYNMTIYTPSQMIASDADVILAIKHVSKQLAGNTEIVCKHIYGHQDSSQSWIQTHTEITDGTESEKSERESDEISLQTSDEEDRRHTPLPLSLEAKINIECDRIATETIDAARGGNAHGLPPVITLPYEGSRALLNIDGKWMTAHQNRYIIMAKWGQKMKEYCCHRFRWDDQEYCCHRFRWDDQQFDSVLWTHGRRATVRDIVPYVLR
jgi:hypothetical protein